LGESEGNELEGAEERFMSDGQPASPPVNKRAGWKRIVLVGLSCGVGIVVAVAAVIFLFNWYNDRPTSAKKWPEIDNPSQGFKITLRTEWRDGRVKYKLHVLPHDQSLAVAFDKVAGPAAKSGSFTVQLEDPSGFELCKIEMVELVPQMGDDGLVHAVEAEGDASGCSRSQYLEASEWNVVYRFPKISSSTSGDDKKTPNPEVTTKRTTRTQLTYPFEGEDSLTGFDYSGGQLETRAGHTFAVQREGERGTALLWTASARLKYSCRSASDCLIVNVDRDEAVHARMVR
jgi:hypothetical protein